MPLATKSPANLAGGLLGQDFLGGGDCGIGSGAAHVGGRLGLCLGDLGLGHLGAAGDEFLALGLGFDRQPLGFRLGAGDDGLRLGSASCRLR